MAKYTDLTNKRFGRLLVIGEAGRNNRMSVLWKCQCDCGGEKIVPTARLNNGQTQSCGCLQAEKIKESNSKRVTHGDFGTRLHKIWANMKSRCKHLNGYNHLTTDPCWDEYANFKTWAMSNGYKEHLTIDRIDNNKGYTPSNCRWATPQEQIRNRTNTRIDEDDAIIIRMMRNEGMKLLEIGNYFNLNASQVSAIVKFKSWDV